MYHHKANDDRHRREEHGIEPVEHSAVAGQKFAHVLYTAAALYRAFEQIAELGEYGCGQRNQHKHGEGMQLTRIFQPELGSKPSEAPHKYGRENAAEHAAERAYHSFVWAGVRGEL